jgi:hypothetical protein
MMAALVAAGCSSSSETPAKIFLTQPPQSEGPGGPVSGGPTPVVDGIVVTSSAPDNSWTFTFKKPLVSGISDAVAATINDAIAAKVSAYIQDFTGGSLPAVASGAAPNTLEGDFSLALVSPSIISVRFSLLTSLSGAAHLVAGTGSINLWVYTGATISLSDIFTDQNAALPSISSKAHAALAASLGTSLTWSGPATSMSFFDSWVITKAGLEFTWAQGKIASGSAGSPSVTLAWSSIKSLIKGSGPAGQFIQ